MIVAFACIRNSIMCKCSEIGIRNVNVKSQQHPTGMQSCFILNLCLFRPLLMRFKHYLNSVRPMSFTSLHLFQTAYKFLFVVPKSVEQKFCFFTTRHMKLKFTCCLTNMYKVYLPCVFTLCFLFDKNRRGIPIQTKC